MKTTTRTGLYWGSLGPTQQRFGWDNTTIVRKYMRHAGVLVRTSLKGARIVWAGPYPDETAANLAAALMGLPTYIPSLPEGC